MGKHSKDHSPKRKRDRHDSSRKHHRDHDSGRSSRKEIDAHKKSMTSRLNSAISDVKRMDQAEASEVRRSNDDYPLTVTETLKRNTQIERIENSGFVPATFISSRSGKKSQAEQKIEDHESAVFGAAWKSKELNRKLAKHGNSNQSAQPSFDSIPLPSGMKFADDFNDFPLAQKWLNTNSEERQQRWLKTFLDQRRQLFDGIL